MRALRRCPNSARARPRAASRRTRDCWRSSSRRVAQTTAPPRAAWRATSARVAAAVPASTPVGRLVDQQHVRSGGERPRERDPALAGLVGGDEAPCARDEDEPGIGVERPGEDAQERRLAGAARADQPMDLAGSDDQVDARQCRARPKATIERSELDQGGVHTPIIWGGRSRCTRRRSRSTRLVDRWRTPRSVHSTWTGWRGTPPRSCSVPSVTGDERAALERARPSRREAPRARGRPARARPGRAARASRPSRRGGAARLAVGADRDAAGPRARPAVPERARRRGRAGERAVAARPVVGRARGRPAARPRRARHEGRGGGGAARGRGAARRRRARGRAAGGVLGGGRRARDVRRAGGATRASTPPCCPSRRRCASSARRRAR